MDNEELHFAATEHFRVIRQLGEGGMGMVYEVTDARDGRQLALKVIRSGRGEEIYRLKREFRALANLSHPNLVDVYELGGEGRGLYVTMELIDGDTFVNYCRGDRARGELGDEKRIRAALVQLVRGLVALHDAGMVHRDIKPSNVLVDGNGRVVVLDFGLVATDGDHSMSGRVVGSAEYMAPEQGSGAQATPAADWYAAGVMLYEALTGQVPFNGTVLEVLVAKQSHPAAPPRALVPEVPADLDALCVALLEQEPARRPTAAELLQRLGVREPNRTAGGSMTGSLTQLVPFCGRRDELQRLAACAARVRGGEPAVAYVRGPSGIGKSGLIAHFINDVAGAEPAFVSLQGRCYERETVPYKAIDAVIDELSRYWSQLPEDEADALLGEQSAHLPRLFPVLGRVPAMMQLPAAPAVPDPQEMRTRGFAALRELFLCLAARRPVVLVLDDLQWIDDDSVTLLADLMRPPDPPPILLLLASRDASDRSRRAATETGTFRPYVAGEPAKRQPELLDRLLDSLPPHQLIELGPLGGADARKLASSLLGDNRNDMVDTVVSEAAGSPFFMAELSRYLRDSPTTHGTGIDDLLEARLSRLSGYGRPLLELLSIAGDPVSRRVAQTALGCSAEQLGRLLRWMRTSQLVRAPGGTTDAVEPYHDRLREHVRAELDLPRRRTLHRRLAMALERWSEGSAEKRARHWYGAGDERRASEYARQAADDALATLQFAQAARLYRLALDTGEHDAAESRALRTSMGVALGHSGRAWDGAAVLLDAAEGADPATSLALRQRSAEALLLGGYVREGIDALERVLSEFGLQLAPTPRRALWSIVKLRAWLRVRGLRWRRRDEADLAPRVLTEIDTYYTVATTLAVVDTIRATEFQARHLLAALRAGEPTRVSRAIGVEAGFQGSLGKPRRGLALADVSDTIADSVDRRDLPPPPFASWARGAVEYFATNRWTVALDHFRSTEELVRSTGRIGWELDTAQLYKGFALLYAGELRELMATVPKLLREAERRGDLYMEVNLRTRLTIVWFAGGDVDRAEREIDEALARWPPGDQEFHVQHWFAYASRVDLALYRGDVDAAMALVDETRTLLRRSMLPRVPLVGVEVAYIEGRVALAAASASTGAAAKPNLHLAARCARRLRRSALPLGHQLCAMLVATTAVVTNSDDAAAKLRAAVDLLEDSGTMLYCHATRRRLGQLIGGDEGAALIATAEAWMADQHIADPAAITRMALGVPA